MENKLVYPATFEEDGKYISVQFPDVEGVFTFGNTLEHAREMAEEAVGLMLEGFENYPVASSVEEIKAMYPEKEVYLVSPKFPVRD